MPNRNRSHARRTAVASPARRPTRVITASMPSVRQVTVFAPPSTKAYLFSHCHSDRPLLHGHVAWGTPYTTVTWCLGRGSACHAGVRLYRNTRLRRVAAQRPGAPCHTSHPRPSATTTNTRSPFDADIRSIASSGLCSSGIVWDHRRCAGSRARPGRPTRTTSAGCRRAPRTVGLGGRNSGMF